MIFLNNGPNWTRKWCPNATEKALWKKTQTAKSAKSRMGTATAESGMGPTTAKSRMGTTTAKSRMGTAITEPRMGAAEPGLGATAAATARKWMVLTRCHDGNAMG